MIFLTSDIGIKSAVEVLRRLSCHGGGQLAAYGIRHIAGGVVHDILCIVCDGAVFGCIGNSIRFHLNGRFLPICRSDIMPNLISSLIDGAGAFLIGHRCLFSIYRLFIGQRFIIPICILVLDRNGVSFCRFLFKIGFISIDKLLLALGRSLRISMPIPSRIFHLVRHTICCHIRTGFCPVRGVPVFGIIDRPFFIMGELALGGMSMICYFSQIRDPIRRDGGSTIMLFAGCCIQLIIFQVDLAYIELAIDRQVFLYGDIFLKFCFAIRGQCAIERGRAGDTERAVDLGILEISIARSELAVYCSRFQLRIPGHGQTFIHLYGFLECRLSSGGELAVDLGILEAGFASHIERAIHIRIFERGIACDSELLIHGHVALEVRCILHFQRACVHSARRGDSAIASIYAFTFQLAFRSHIAFRLHIAKVIDSHIVFDRSFVCSVIAGDSGGTLIGRSDSVLIGLNVTFIGFDLALEIDILRFEVSDIRCHFAIQRSDFPFQCYIRSIAILNFLVDLIIQCCIGYNAVSDLCVNLIIQRRIRRNAVSDLCVNLIIQRRIGCNAISDLLVDLLIQLVVSFFARKSFRLYFCRSRDRSPREALAVDIFGFYVRKPGNRTISITHNVSIFYSNTINASSSPISIRNIGGLLLQIFNSRILFTSCCF